MIKYTSTNRKDQLVYNPLLIKNIFKNLKELSERMLNEEKYLNSDGYYKYLPFTKRISVTERIFNLNKKITIIIVSKCSTSLQQL